jgi:hypothetical protein
MLHRAGGQHLALDRRTLSRRLKAQGNTYSRTLNRVRLDVLHDYMRRDDLSLTEIAPLLGFSSLPALSRWRSQHDDKPWLRELERTGEAFWTDGDNYIFAFALPEGPRRGVRGESSKAKRPAKLSPLGKWTRAPSGKKNT